MKDRLKKELVVICAMVGLATGLPGTVAAASDEAQSIRTPEGAKLTFLGVTHGKEHRAPQHEWLGTGNWIYTPTHTTVAWIKAEHGQEQRPYYELLISDRGNTACVVTEMKRTSHIERGVDLRGFMLDAFPRWDKETILRLRPHGGEIFEGQFVVTNPTHNGLLNWTTEPLPNTKSDGDLEVTMTRLLAGSPAPRRRKERELKSDPLNQCVRVALDILERGQPTIAWKAGLVQTFDRSGNVVQSALAEYPRDGIYDYPKPGDPGTSETDGYFYRPGLWPGVIPWKIRLEFNRISDFSDEEIVTFSNLPVQSGTEQDFEAQWTWDQGQTNHTFTAAEVNGLRLKALRPLLIPDRWEAAKKRISFIIYTENDAMAQQMRLTLLAATDETGQEIHTPSSPVWAGHFSLDFQNVSAPKTLTLKLALHKKRFLEFIVTPTAFPLNGP
jgi:hypothetical protein